jgi:tryptophan halogenase
LIDIKNITIVGGGTAGWLSAFFLKKKYQEHNIKLIESTSIGILGAGEGGTPNLHSILIDEFGFCEEEFLKKVNGTKKYGIVFDKWNDKKQSFIHGFGNDGSESEAYSYHFDARLFAEYLKNKSIDKGVIHIDDEVLDFTQINNQVNKILLKSGNEIETDFVVDCSGFHRLIIGNLYNSKWNSYEDELLINSAVPFFINEPNSDIKQRTIAEAIEWGWIWKIPLQNRWGCGYLYNDTMIDDEFIKKEIERLYGNKNIQINKKIRFKAGSYENVWVENCVAVGLSGGFLEPLEATSIMTIIFQLRSLPEDVFDSAEKYQYNYNVKQFNLQNMMFIRHHYNCNRNDSFFWKTYKLKNLPDLLKNVYDSFHNEINLYQIYKTKYLTFNKNQYKHIYNNNFPKTKKTFL